MVVVEIFQLLSSLVLGLLVGSLLTEAMILVPYWRTMDPAQFLKLHGTLGPKLFRYFAPLTILATTLPIVAAILPFVLGGMFEWLSIVPAALVIVMLVIYFVCRRSWKNGPNGIGLEL